jgi:hypothetical protein
VKVLLIFFSVQKYKFSEFSVLYVIFEFLKEIAKARGTRFIILKKRSKEYLHSKKKFTHFATKSSEIIISFRKAGFALQKRVLLYKKQKKTKSKIVEFCYTGLIRYTIYDM